MINTRIENHGSIVLFYGDTEKNKKEYELYYNLTGLKQSLHFYRFTNSSVIQQINTTATITEPCIIVLKIFDEHVNIFNGTFNALELKEFIEIYSRPVLSNLDSDSYMSIMNEKKTFIALLIDDDNQKSHAIEDRFYAESLKYRKSIMAFVGDLYTTLTREFNVKTSELPVMLIEEFEEGKSPRKFKSNAINFENDQGISNFFHSFFMSKICVIQENYLNILDQRN